MAKILLVEDDNNLREIYEARLTAEGYDIATAQDGETALVVAKQEHPDLIISDVMMPRISGFEMLDILRNTNELKDTKVIMLTALGQAEDQTRAGNLGADLYLVKSQVTLEDIVKGAQVLLSKDGKVPVPASAAPTEDTTTPAATPEPPTTAPITENVAPTDAPAPLPEPELAPVPEIATEPVATAPETTVPPEVTTAAEEKQPEPVAPPVEPVTEPTVTPPPRPVMPDVPVVPDPAAPADITTVTDEPVTPASIPAPAQDTPQVTDTPVASEPTDTTVATPANPDPAPVVSPPIKPLQPAEPVDETANDTSAPEQKSSQSLAAESATINEQINEFAEAPAETSFEITPTDEPAAAATDNSEAATEKVDDALLAEAVNELSANAPPVTDSTPTIVEPPTPDSATTEPTVVAPSPAEEPVPAAPVQPEQQSDSEQVPIAHKKVIQPLSFAEEKPNLDELLAKEAAKEQAATGVVSAPVINGAPGPKTDDTPANLPKAGDTIDPNSIAL